MAVNFYETFACHSPCPSPSSVPSSSSHALPTSSSLPALQFASLLVCRAWLDVWLVVRQLSDLYVLFNIIMAGRFAAGTRCCPVAAGQATDSTPALQWLSLSFRPSAVQNAKN